MLVYTQSPDDSANDVIIDLTAFGKGLVTVQLVRVKGDKARMGYTGDKSIPIHRRCVYESIQREQGDGT